MLPRHFDEARAETIQTIGRLLGQEPAIERAVIIDDLFGKIRAAIWVRTDEERIRAAIDGALDPLAAPYWTHEIWIAGDGSKASTTVFDRAWADGSPVTDRLRIVDRHRQLGSWVQALGSPPWSAPLAPPEGGPPIVVFYSFKGGMGRSTSLASFAVQRARAGERVAVLDLDLDAPGVSSLLAADENGTTADWGIVDYLLERPFGSVDLRQYYHACRRSSVTGPGEILVFPAGKVNDGYLGKLARVDFEPARDGAAAHPLALLLQDIREQLRPDWMLLDSRTGLSEPAGLLLGGIAHLYVLLGSASPQSWDGIGLILERLGGDRVRMEMPQAECVMAQALVPEDAVVVKAAVNRFAERSRDEFSNHYYSSSLSEDAWDIGDLESPDAPHVPVVLYYKAALAHFEGLDDVVERLANDRDFQQLAERITDRFRVPEE